MNNDIRLTKKVLEIGTASLKNYVKLVRQWFGNDLSQYNFYLMPISFFRETKSIEILAINGQEKRLLEYVNKLEENTNEDEHSDFNLALELEVRFKRVSDSTTGVVRVTNDPEAIAIKLEEEDFRQQYPLDYAKLTTKLTKRYKNFKINTKYHEIRKRLSVDEKFCRLRLLDPGNPRSQKKEFFNPNIVREFDLHYDRS